MSAIDFQLRCATEEWRCWRRRLCPEQWVRTGVMNKIIQEGRPGHQTWTRVQNDLGNVPPLPLTTAPFHSDLQ
ncbi:hypothetical protein GN956_G18874 [Arapaima gigas]